MASTSRQANELETRARGQHELPRPVRRAVRRDALRAVWRAEPQLTFAEDGQITTSERQLYFVERDAVIATVKRVAVEDTAPAVARLLELASSLRHLVTRAQVAEKLLAQHPAPDRLRHTNETHTPEAVVTARRRREHAASVAKLTTQLRDARAEYESSHAEAIRLVAQLHSQRENYLRRVDELRQQALLRRELFDTLLCQGRQDRTLLEQRLEKSEPPVPAGLEEFELPDLSFLEKLDSATDTQGGERERT